MDFRDYSINQLVTKIKSKEISAKELTQEALDNVEKIDKTLNAFCSINDQDAIRQASEIDERLAKGEEIGQLAGIPIGVKDLEDAKGFVTTYGSALHVNDQPAEEDSVLVSRLRNAGCVVLGKTKHLSLVIKGKLIMFLLDIQKILGI